MHNIMDKLSEIDSTPTPTDYLIKRKEMYIKEEMEEKKKNLDNIIKSIESDVEKGLNQK